MPIKDKSLYPENWKEISKYIRFIRAKNKCEFCGAENYSIVDNKKIILTVAHLDHNPQNNDLNNLRALCQKCHLNYDLKQHIENAKQTRYAKKYKDQLNLFKEWIMNQDLKEKLEFKYSKMPEIAYYVMLIVVVSIIIASSIGTFLIRKATGTEIILIPDNIYKFIIDVLGIFVLPISVKIGGEVFVQALGIWKGVHVNGSNNSKQNEHHASQERISSNYNPQEIQEQYETFYHTSQMYDLTNNDNEENATQKKRKK